MKLLTPIEDLIVARMHRSMARHATYGDWLSEISHPMFRQLVREGMVRALALIVLVALAGFAFSTPDEPARTAQPVLWAGFILAVSVWGWKQLAGRCVEREFLYRRQHGKWRWEL